MAGINKWKTKKHFEVLISCTENKTKKPTQKQEGEDAFQPPVSPWWVSGFFFPLQADHYHVIILNQSSFAPVFPYFSEIRIQS